MQSFQLFVRDDRYSVPTLVFLEVSSAGRARTRATDILFQSPHHKSVEVFRGGQRLFFVGSERLRPSRGDSVEDWPPLP